MKEQYSPKIQVDSIDKENPIKKHAVISIRESSILENDREIEEEESNPVVKKSKPEERAQYEYVDSFSPTKAPAEKLIDAIVKDASVNSSKKKQRIAEIIRKRMGAKTVNEAKIVQVYAGEKLSPEDLKTQTTVYEQVRRCEEWLKAKYGNKQKDELGERNLKDFKSSPYRWMRMDLRSRIIDSEIKLKTIKDNVEQERVRQGIEKNRRSLSNLTWAYERNIPLKLERNFTPLEINLDNGRLFKVEQFISDLNKNTGKNSNHYEVVSVVERANKDLIVFKTDKGEIVEVNMEYCENILREKRKNEDKNEQVERKNKMEGAA